jgi:adenylate kinase
MRLLLIGPPGSGKGTQAKLLSERHNLAHIGTGDLLRDAIRLNTPAGQLARPYLDRGELVPDAVVNQMVAEYFERPNRPERFVMDGYPRSKSQAVAFDALVARFGLDLQTVIALQVPDEALIIRLGGRRICPVCQTLYHIISKLPKADMRCDLDGTPLEQRKDDQEATIRTRLEVYHQTIGALLDHYRVQGKLIQVNADDEIEDVYQQIMRQLPIA